MKLTSRERLERIFRNEEIDRPALKLWGAGLNPEPVLHPAYLPVNRLAAETTDLFGGAGFPFNIHAGANIGKYQETYTTEADHPDWRIHHTVFHLCPSAGHMEYPEPTEKYIENLLFYLQYGLEAVERCRR